ncbi:DUF3566 domain-containing protein [Actinobaculum sp. 352]|uniref:DUF3566 domain-containing protein n=1 Tax=Actinobaculum sp. 352 TaxID=2490946 RepID=UPI001F49A6E4|nr:DUF3566 domain-containing protein [Actinobaculum sp. 352]
MSEEQPTQAIDAPGEPQMPRRRSTQERMEDPVTPPVDAPKRAVGIRRVKMTIAKVEPLSVLKLGFLFSVALGVMIVIAWMLLWFVLDRMSLFAEINDLLETLNSEQLLQLAQYLGFGRWMSFGVIVAILDVVLFTALSAVGALVYNLIASLVGGLHISVTDE